jgi:CelD/BcsL family acetyltransferase involved in cellulose biosynthesis
MVIRIKEINDTNEFMDIRETWDSTLWKCDDNNVFLTWECLWTWWKHYGKESRLMILLAEERDNVIAIAPLMRSVYRIFGLKLRKIEFLGASKHSDYSNFILTEKKTECLRLFIDYLNDYPLEWDCLEFRGIPETAESLNSLRGICKDLYTFEERPYSICPYIPLPKSFDTYYGSLDGKMRKDLRRCLRRLVEKHKIDFKRHNDNQILHGGLQTLFELHQRRAKSKGLPGSFSDQEFIVFVTDIVKLFAKNGWVNISVMTADDQPIASALSFEYNEKFYYYNSGLNPTYSKYSPSRLLLLHLIEDCIRKGLKEFDFLRGAEAYKSNWNTLNRRSIELSKSKGLLSSLYSRIKKSDGFIARKLKSIHKY